MLRLTIFTSGKEFAQRFERCCKEYTDLHIATAWLGDPKYILPHAHLKHLKGAITATVGRSFNSTHPDGLKLLRRLKADLRIFRDDSDLFHPKVYLFSAGRKLALFVGSSNLTYSGFYSNVEANAVMEGVPSQKEQAQMDALCQQLREWRGKERSFVPTPSWLRRYRKAFDTTLRKQRKAKIRTPALREEELPVAGWLGTASWNTYYGEVMKGLKRSKRDTARYLDVLRAGRRQLPLPWNIGYFGNLEKRKIIYGAGGYGWLGHVGASGGFRHMLAKGTRAEKQTIVHVINAIASLNPPLNWNRLHQLLRRLVGLGPTMKVWSRLLCLVRPELYCTVSSVSVRKNLSEVLEVPQTSFQSPEGYLQLLKVLHAAPWFQAARPKGTSEAAVWRNKAAFIDGIFYD